MKSISKLTFFSLALLVSFTASKAMQTKSALKQPKPTAQAETSELLSLCNELKNTQDAAGADRMLDVIKMRSAKNSHLNSGNSNSDTPLHLTVQYYCQVEAESLQKSAYLEATKILLNAQASTNVQNKKGKTPLHVAVFYDQAPVVQMLLKAKADPSIVDLDGNSALYLASLKPTSETALLFRSLAPKKKHSPKHSPTNKQMQEKQKKEEKKDDETFIV